MVSAGVITASDRSSRGERADASGPALAALLARIPARPAGLRFVPDTVRDIRGALRAFLRDPEVKLILTTGGTGVAQSPVLRLSMSRMERGRHVHSNQVAYSVL